MKSSLLELLVCPSCKASLDCRIRAADADEILEGTMTCSACARSYAISRGVPRFVDADAYASTFSLQRLYVRRHFGSYLHDRSGDRVLEPSTGIPLAQFAAGLSLEIGCGYGRFLDTIDRTGGEVIGIDLSTHSVDLAFDFVGRRKRVHIVQCDLFSLPFRTGTFDRVFSVGVLHHTPDTRKSFLAVAPYAKEGGRVSIWVYDPWSKRSSDVWRKVTVRLHPSVLYAWCVFNQIAFTWVRALPGGWRFGRIVPGAPPQEPFWKRVMGDFDNLSPDFAHSHRHDEVVEWFQEAGLTNVTALPCKTAVTGTASHASSAAQRLSAPAAHAARDPDPVGGVPGREPAGDPSR